MLTSILLSGGLDSAVLLVEEAARGEVLPIYVSVGLSWERAERDALRRFLAAARLPTARPLVALSVDMNDVYAPGHWARTGDAPEYHTPDEDVYLAGRNIILLAKAAVYCASAGAGRLLIGTLDHNPFPDATPEFRAAMARALSLGLAHSIKIDAPYAQSSKADVIRRGVALGAPLDLTLSCMNPVSRAQQVQGGQEARWVHCGRCSKCRERHDAFVAAGVVDSTDYADRAYTS